MISLPRRALLALAIALAATLAPPARADGPLNLDRAGLAIRGYDPVAYFREGKAVPGRAEFTAVHDAATYRFASAANRDAFAAAPARYLPAYGGYCAWAAAQGYKADADPQAFTVVGDRLFLNYNRDVHRTWERDVAGNVAKADANWPRIR
jgi:hypothetical protein